jgi:chromosome segregation ATPase
MKSNTVAIILVLICIGLGVFLLVESKHHEEERQTQQTSIAQYSNNVVNLEGQLREQTNVNYTLATNLTETKAVVVKASNDLVNLKGTLSSTQDSLEKTQVDAKAAAEKATTDLAEKDRQIASLESQNQDLDKTSTELRTSITNKQMEIDATQKKLAVSEGDKVALLKELKDLQAQKEDLEKKFNDLAVLKDQVQKLKDDLTLARKLDWIRRGIYNSIAVKGGERLMHPLTSAPPLTNAAMDVEIHQDGGVKINAPAPTNSMPVK